MKADLMCILLVDDDPNDILFHKRAIEKANIICEVVAKESATLALEFIQSRASNGNAPELIFVDINLPGMSGWDFVEAYQQLMKGMGAHTKSIIVMLSASGDRDDEEKARNMTAVSGLFTKPLRKEMIEDLIAKHFA